MCFGCFWGWLIESKMFATIAKLVSVPPESMLSGCYHFALACVTQLLMRFIIVGLTNPKWSTNRSGIGVIRQWQLGALVVGQAASAVWYRLYLPIPLNQGKTSTNPFVNGICVQDNYACTLIYIWWGWTHPRLQNMWRLAEHSNVFPWWVRWWSGATIAT